MMKRAETSDGAELELLLPWYAAGTLGRGEVERLDRALASDQELSRLHDLVREELTETVRVNQSLPAPMAGVMERLMSRIEAETGSVPARSGWRNPAARLASRLIGLAPRRLSWTAAAACAVILIQAGLLGAAYVQWLTPARYDVASVPEPAIGVAFVSGATVADVAKLAETHHLSIVQGPLAGGLFKMRIASGAATKDDLERLVAQLRQHPIVRLAAVAE